MGSLVRVAGGGTRVQDTSCTLMGCQQGLMSSMEAAWLNRILNIEPSSFLYTHRPWYAKAGPQGFPSTNDCIQFNLSSLGILLLSM